MVAFVLGITKMSNIDQGITNWRRYDDLGKQHKLSVFICDVYKKTCA